MLKMFLYRFDLYAAPSHNVNSYLLPEDTILGNSYNYHF